MAMGWHNLALLGLASLLMLSLSAQTVTAEDVEGEEAVDAIEEEGEEDFDEDNDADIEAMSINGQTISFGIPEDDDDFHSMHIPENLKCDACKVLARQYQTAFDKANEKRPSLKKKLTESMVIDVLEDVCDDEFTNVGVKEVNGVKRLSGPGSSIEESPGIMQGGGKWPYRMQALCADIVGEVGEDEIYELYLSGGLESRLCLVEYKACVTTLKDGRKRIEL